jgi:hypothetical protein
MKQALSILKHADMLGVPAESTMIPRSYLCSSQQGQHVQDTMQHACCIVYPDPNHYMRIHIKLIQSPSNCITADVTLYNAGVAIPVIAIQLWTLQMIR